MSPNTSQAWSRSRSSLASPGGQKKPPFNGSMFGKRSLTPPVQFHDVEELDKEPMKVEALLEMVRALNFAGAKSDPKLSETPLRGRGSLFQAILDQCLSNYHQLLIGK